MSETFSSSSLQSAWTLKLEHEEGVVADVTIHGVTTPADLQVAVDHMARLADLPMKIEKLCIAALHALERGDGGVVDNINQVERLIVDAMMLARKVREAADLEVK